VRLFGDKLLVYNDPGDGTCLHSLDASTGAANWDKLISGGGGHPDHGFLYPMPPSYIGNTMYMFSTDYWAFGVDLGTGATVMAANLARQVSNLNDPLIAGGFLVQDGMIFIIDSKYIYCWRLPGT
jgi:outer membrane protein assembly factor BamB